MRIAVMGVGGVGAYFGARLAAAGNDVVFIARGTHLDAIRERGLRVDSVLGDMLIRPAQVSESSWRRTLPSALVSVPSTVRWSGCAAKPRNPVPS